MELFHVHKPQLVFGGVSKEDSPHALIGYPVDVTTLEKPGSRYGPEAIRKASLWMEDNSWIVPDFYYDYNPLHDVGDIARYGSPRKCIEALQESITELLKEHKLVFVIGGEHTSAYASVKALGAEGTTLVMFDAHLDMRERYPQDLELSHATFARALIEAGAEVIVYGARAFAREEIEFARSRNVAVVKYSEIAFGGRKCFDKLKDSVSTADKVVVSVDIDVLDPSYAPGVAYPEPGGLDLPTLLEAVKTVVEECGRRIKVFEVVEVNPLYDVNEITAATAARIVHEVHALMLGV